MYFCLIKQFHRNVIDNHETGYLIVYILISLLHVYICESHQQNQDGEPVHHPQSFLKPFWTPSHPSALGKPVVCFLSLYTLLHCLLFHLNGVMQYVLLKTWVLWLRISSSSVLQQVPAVHFFSRLTSVPIYGDTTNFLFIHFLFHPFHHVVDIWVVCSF